MLCLQDTDYLKEAEDGQEHVYHSMHTVEHNSLKSLVTHSGVLKLGHTRACAVAISDCAPQTVVWFPCVAFITLD